MKKLLLFLLIFNTLGFSQKAKIDSIRANLPEIKKNDTTYFYHCATLIDHYYSSNIDSAIFFIEEAIDITKKCKWHESEINLYTQLAFAYNSKGNIFKAIDFNYKALMLAEKNKKDQLIHGISRVLGESYGKLKQYDKAKILIQKGIEGARKQKDLVELCAGLTALATIEQELKNYQLSEKYFREVVPIVSQTKDLHLQGIAYHNLGNILAKQSKSKEAKAFLEKSLAIHQEENHFYSMSNLNIDLAEINFSEKAYNLSVNFAQKAIFYAKKSNSPEMISQANYWLYQNFQQLGFDKKALFHYKNHILLKDSLNKEDFQKRINSLQFEYENAQKNTEIASQKIELLRKDNENLALETNRNLILAVGVFVLLIAGFLFWNRRQLRKINETLELKVKERTVEISEANLALVKKNEEISEALFKGQSIERKRVATELHDNLSSLLSALKMSLQAIKTTNFSENEKKIYGGVLEMMNNAYREVRNISHNILPEELERIGLVKTLEKIIEKINLSEVVEVSLSSNLRARVDTKIEFNLYSVCLELLNNIIKHSKATKATILIESEENLLLLKVKDNGIGIKTEKKEGIGLQNIKSRVEAINGKILVESKENIGTETKISVPL